MAKLYYGDGTCSIEGSENIRAIHIKYIGNISVEDKTGDSFAMTMQNNGIIIFPIGEGTLNNLFNYHGEFQITYLMVADNNSDKVSTTINRVMDYAELLNTNAEDMTTNSEKLNKTYISGSRTVKNSIDKNSINNLHTSKHDGNLFLKDGTLYEGYFHVHLSNNSAMTEKEHSENSEDLYYENGKSTKNPKLIPEGAIIQNRKIKNKAIRRSRVNNRSSY